MDPGNARDRQSSSPAHASETHGASVSGVPKNSTAYAYPVKQRPRWYAYKLLFVVLFLVIGIVGSVGAFVGLGNRSADNAQKQVASSGVDKSYKVQTIDLEDLATSGSLGLATSQSLSINGQLRANNSLILTPSGQPGGATIGQIYYDENRQAVAYYNGAQFIDFAGTDDVQALLNRIQQVESSIPTIPQIPTVPTDLARLNSSNTFSNLNNFNGGLDASRLSVQGAASLQGSLEVAGSTKLGAVEISNLLLTSALGVSSGGTGQSSFATNGVVIGQGTDPLTTVSASTTGLCLMSTNGAPEFQPCPGGVGSGVNSLNGLSGTLSITNATAAGSVITLNDATTSSKGIARFNASNFSVVSGVVDTAQNISVTATPSFAGLTLTSPLAVGSGGTGAVSLPTDGVVIGRGTASFVGVTAAGAGQCLMSTAGTPIFQTCPGSTGGTSVASLNGLSGALVINNASASGSSLTLNDATTSSKGIASFNAANLTVAGGAVNTVQNINTSAAPTFGGLTVNGAINGQTVSNNASFTGSLSVGTALSAQSGSFTGTVTTGGIVANTVSATANMSVGSSGYALALQGNASTSLSAVSGGNTTSLTFAAPTANVTYRLQAATAGTYDICTTAGNCSGVGGGVTTPGGTAGRLARFSAGQTIADSIISDNGTTVTVAGILAVNTIAPSGAMTVGSTTQTLALQGNSSTTLSATAAGFTNTLQFASPSGSSKTITLPNASGTVVVSAAGPLAIDANGNISCAGCVTSGGGSGGSSAVDSLNGLSGAITIGDATTSGQNITLNVASATQRGLASFNATNFSVTSGAVNTVQNISVTAAPTFAGLTVNGSLTATGTINGATISGGSISGGTISGGTLSTSHVNGLGVSSGAIAAGGALSVSAGGTNQSLTLQGSGSGSVIIKNPSFQNANGATYTFAASDASSSTATICTTLGNCTGASGGGVTSSGTSGHLALFGSDGYNLQNSIVTQSGSVLNVAGTVVATALQGDGSGVSNVNASQLGGQSSAYYLNASNLNAGTVADARLSSNVALYNRATSNFTGTLQQNGNNVCTTAGNCAGSGAGLGGSGTAGTIAVWNGSGFTLGDSLLSQASTTVTVAGDLAAVNIQGNGANITNINASNINTGFLSDARLSSNVTLAGNAFNAANSLVRLNASGQLPSLDASLLTSLNAGSIATGTLADARLSSNVALYNRATSNFTGTLQQNGNNVCTTAGNCSSSGAVIASGSGTSGRIAKFNGSGQLADSSLSETSGTLSYTGNVVVQNAASVSLFNLDSATSTLKVGQASTTDTFTKLANPAVTPGSTASGTAWSPDGAYMAITSSSTPFVTIYKRSGDTFTKLSDPATLPAGSATAAAFSPDGIYLSVSHTTSPYVTTYKRSGDTFTKLSDPATLPANNGNDVAWSADGQYMSVVHATSPFVTIYKRSGDTLTKVANPATLPGSTAYSVTFSPDSIYMAIGQGGSTPLTIYKRSGDVFTRLADPATLPPNTTRGVSFSPDGQYLAAAHATSPFVTIYKRSGDTFTKLSDPATLPAGTAYGASFSPNGTYLAISTTTSPTIIIYKRSGDTFTKLSDPAVLPSGIGYDTSFSVNDQYLATANANSPYVNIYKIGDGSYVDITINGVLNGSSASLSSLAVSGLTTLQGNVAVTGSTTFTNTVAVTNALSVSGPATFTGSTGVTIGTVGSLQGKLMLASTGTGAVTLQASSQSGNFALNIPNLSSDDTVCLQTLGNCAGTGSGTSYTNGGNSFTTQGGGTAWTRISSNTNQTITNPVLGLSSNSAIDILTNNTSRINIAADGDIKVLSNSGNSTQKFVVRTQYTGVAGEMFNTLRVDTASDYLGRVGIGLPYDQAPEVRLDIGGNASGRVSVANGGLQMWASGTPGLSRNASNGSGAQSTGRIYFDELTGKFKVSENGGSWTDLIQTAGSSPVLLGGQSVASTAVIGTTNNYGLTLKTNDTDRIQLSNTGNMVFRGASGSSIDFNNSSNTGSPLLRVDHVNSAILINTTNSIGGTALNVNGRINTTGYSINGVNAVSLSCGASNQTIGAFQFNNGLLVGGSCQNNNSDIAEAYNSADNLATGEIVMAAGTGSTSVKRATSAGADKLMGVVSTEPAQTIGTAQVPNGYPIALVGRVPVKVNGEGGAISVGDKITISSVPGVGKKMTGAGMTVGTAVEAFNGSGQGSIEVFVHLSYYEPTQAEVLQAQAASFGDLNISGVASIERLEVQTVNVAGNLTVKGSTTVQNITVKGHVITSSGQPTSQALAAIAGGSVSISGNDTAGTITVVTGNTPVAGELIKLVFSEQYSATPRVIISASNEAAAGFSYFKGQTDLQSVTINSRGAPDAHTTYKFDYFISQ